jgi:acetylornithine deacetylase/succinyl-diaminopimelate desuccinylase-like protein
MKEILGLLDSNRERHFYELCELLRIPSVSTDPERKGDVKRCAEAVAARLQRAGIQSEIVPTAGHPVVYGEWLQAAGKPTVLVYGHYDVQPPDPLELWTSPPFEPTVREGQLYARGSADDKGQFFIHVAAAEAHLQTSGRLPVNLKFVLEGEEEVGSPNLEPFVQQNRDKLAADVVMISDTPFFARGMPTICTGLRGLAYLELRMSAANRDLHSGTYGGAVRNPAEELARLIARLKDDQGRILIPGFYDQVRQLSAREREEYARLPFDEAAYAADLGVEALHGEAGYSTLERVSARPTLEVNGLLSGWTGAGSKTVLPNKAMAKVSMRLVADQDPEKIAQLFTRHLESLVPRGARLEVLNLHGGRPFLADINHPAVQATARALERAFGQRPVFSREGGTIPIAASFKQHLGLTSVFMGIGVPDENLHAPNEHLDLDNFYGGIRASALFLKEYAG